jgi:diketogulonate reductase-like aldo/keto reductase
LGKPDDEDDFNQYIAAKHLIRSGAVNIIDTAINYRCQKAERTIGAVLKSLFSDEFGKFEDQSGSEFRIKRDEIFICSKNGYVPDDADNGIPASLLVS